MAYKPKKPVVCISCRDRRATEFFNHNNRTCLGRCRDCYEKLIMEVCKDGFTMVQDGGHFILKDRQPWVNTVKRWDPAALDEFYEKYAEELKW